MKVYMVHYGFLTRDGETKPAGPVTFRLHQEEAQEIANLLNNKHLDLRYHEFLAAQSNRELLGGAAQLLAEHSDEQRGKFLELEKEQPQFEVSELNIEGEDEEELKRELSAHNKE